MNTEQPPTPDKKFYEKYLEQVKIFFKKLKTKDFKSLLTSNKQKVSENLQDNTPPNQLSLRGVLVGISAGFVFGAFMSSVMLYFKIRKIEKEYQKTKIRLQILSSRVKTYQANKPNNQNSQNQDFQAQVLNVINNLPPSNAFASFYINKLNEAKIKEEQKLAFKKSSQNPPPTPLPPLKTLIGKNENSTNLPLGSALVPPPLPEVSMIICSNGCYAISPSGQVYTNGFTQGNYKLVVTQNQVYWEKTK
ncbi:hypothetical protein [Hydrogenobaculum acidophilum]